MYKKILIATDGSALSEKAVQQGLSLAHALHSSVVAVTVVMPWFPPIQSADEIDWDAETHERAGLEYANKLLGAIDKQAKQLGVLCTKRPVTGQLAAEGILETARKERCDLIVMASHGKRGFERLLLGSETLTVLTYSQIPVLVCR